MVALSFWRGYSNNFPKISNMGHNYIAFLVAFLLVSRVNTSYARYRESRNHLAAMFRDVRELISTMAAVTEPQNDTKSSKEWRLEVAYRTCLLLRTAMAVVDYPADEIAPWDLGELNGTEKDDVVRHTYLNPKVAALQTERLSEFEESLRVPVRIAYLLRKSIHSHEDRLNKPLHIAHEGRLLGSVDSFMSGYYGIRKFLTTPVPFPIVQMARTFMFFYVFTIPLRFYPTNCVPIKTVNHVFQRQGNWWLRVFIMQLLFLSSPMGLSDWRHVPLNWTIRLGTILTIWTISLWHTRA